jgi:hypothetical protein
MDNAVLVLLHEKAGTTFHAEPHGGVRGFKISAQVMTFVIDFKVGRFEAGHSRESRATELAAIGAVAVPGI